MKIISDYTIHCTPEQTKRALELGAHLEKHLFHASIIDANRDMFKGIVGINERYYYLPTAEQMIGWLEEQHPIDYIDIYKQVTTWRFYIYTSILHRRTGKRNSRKEVTLAAIDAALEYLTNNKR